MAKTTTERVAVWLTPEQVAWLKTKENVSVTLRALVNEAMNMQRLADSLKQKEARSAAAAKSAAGKTQKPKPEQVKATLATAKATPVAQSAKRSMPSGPRSATMSKAKARTASVPPRTPTRKK